MLFHTIICTLAMAMTVVSAPAPIKVSKSCNLQGYIARTGVQINGTSSAVSAIDCSSQCASQSTCRSFSYDSQHGCKLFILPVQALQFTTQPNANALLPYKSTFYNKWCLNQTATATSPPTSTSAAPSTVSTPSSTTPTSAPTCSSVTVGTQTYTQYFSGAGVTLSTANPGANPTNPREGRYVKEILYGTTDACHAIQTCAGLSSYYGWVFGSFDVHYMQAEGIWVCSTFANAVSGGEAMSSWNVPNADVSVAYGFSL
jgi:hypothetical protein